MKEIKGRILNMTGESSALLYKNLSFYEVNLRDGSETFIARLPVKRIDFLLSKFRLTDRLLRIEPRCSIDILNKKFLISMLHKVWLLNVDQKKIITVYDGRDSFSDCLNFCFHQGKVYWGDYGANIDHQAINIYRFDADGAVCIAYTFPAGRIMHIHNIVLDEKEKLFWVLAGDNEPSAGIYKASLDWIEVKPFKIGDQRYRAVVGFPYKGGLLYATDSVETENYLRLINKDGTEKTLTSINGSCIYGCETKNHYLFSTTVEPHEGVSSWRKFDNRLGGGIKSWDVHIIAVSKKDLSICIVKTLRKDWLPMVLFQYGRVRFAGGQQGINTVWCSPVACKRFDGKTIKIEL